MTDLAPVLKPLPKFVRVVIKKGDSYLMMFQDSLGRYVCAGGKLEPNEEWAEAAIRELKEETTLDLIEATFLTERIFYLQSTTDPKPIKWLGRFYHATVVSGTPSIQEPHKHHDLHFVPLICVPSIDDLSFVLNPQQLTIHPMILDMVPLFSKLKDTKWVDPI